MLADALLEHRLPRHQAEAKPVFDHSVAPAGEFGRAGDRATDILAGIGALKVMPRASRHFLPDPLDLLALQPGDEVARQDEGCRPAHA